MVEFWSFLQSALHYAVPFLIVLSVVVFVHEFGHFIVARWCGVKVETFSIGFGPVLWGRKDKHGTRWCLSALPLGGYVKMFGDADAASSRPDEKLKELSEQEKKDAFYTQSAAKRIAITVAGPLSNYLFAILLLALLFIFAGHPFTPPVAGEIIENGAALRAGMQAGDVIKRVDGQTINRFEDIKRIVALSSGQPMPVELEREGKVLTLSVTPELVMTTDRLGGEHRLGQIGIKSQAVAYEKLDPFKAVISAITDTWNISVGTLKAVGQMIAGTRGAEELGGPLRIAEMSGNVAKEGGSALLWFMAVISINLGLINLFPIPLLDGGNMVFYIVEILRRRPLSEQAQEIGSRIGVFLVLSLMVFATWNDLVHLRVISYLSGLFS